MSKPRVIKKYPNRRLYDTEESRYITLSDVKELVMNKVEFEVIDKKSGEDITRTILLQTALNGRNDGFEPIAIEAMKSLSGFRETVEMVDEAPHQATILPEQLEIGAG